jgi:hypothetical protein
VAISSSCEENWGSLRRKASLTYVQLGRTDICSWAAYANPTLHNDAATPRPRYFGGLMQNIPCQHMHTHAHASVHASQCARARTHPRVQEIKRGPFLGGAL